MILDYFQRDVIKRRPKSGKNITAGVRSKARSQFLLICPSDVSKKTRNHRVTFDTSQENPSVGHKTETAHQTSNIEDVLPGLQNIFSVFGVEIKGHGEADFLWRGKTRPTSDMARGNVISRTWAIRICVFSARHTITFLVLTFY